MQTQIWGVAILPTVLVTRLYEPLALSNMLNVDFTFWRGSTICTSWG